MQQLTNQEIRKVFALYYESEHKWIGYDEASIIINHNTGDISCSKFVTSKLLLTPLDQIPESNILCMALNRFGNYDSFGREYPIATLIKKMISVLKNSHFVYQEYQYLIALGIAVPLWLGTDHWANGKTAIELVVAMERMDY
jgi:hypothetical protein